MQLLHEPMFDFLVIFFSFPESVPKTLTHKRCAEKTSDPRECKFGKIPYLKYMCALGKEANSCSKLINILSYSWTKHAAFCKDVLHITAALLPVTVFLGKKPKYEILKGN